MNKKFLASLMALSSISLGVVAVSTQVTGAISSPTILTEETNVGVTFTNNFNPVDSQSVGTQMSLNALSYEPLIQYNAMKPNVWTPWIATNEVFNATGQVVTFTINPKAEWSNGSPVTAAQVANEFNVINTNAGMNVFGVPTLATPATASGNKVTLTFPTPQFANQDALGSVLIFPVAGDNIPGYPAGSPVYITAGTSTLTNNDVLGNGPYLPTGYNTQLISYTASPHWKMTAKPYVTGVHVPYYAANQDATQALVTHQLDWAGNDIPQIKQVFIASNPAQNHFYYPAGSTVTLWFNVSSSAPDGNRDCLADPYFRYAVSMAIDRNQLSQIGETGFEQPATSTSGMTPAQAAYEGPYKNNYNLNGWTYAQVTKYLKDHGFAVDSNSYFAVNTATAAAQTHLSINTECQFSIQDPTGYSDYAEDEQMISATLQGDHINVNTVGVTTGQWNANIFTHNFDAMIHWGAGGTNPYSQFENWLDDPANTGGSTNYGAYQNSAAQADLVALSGLRQGTPAFQAEVNKLSAIMTNDVPVAPLLYGADWDAYTTARFTGWVTPTNQYAYPGPGTNDVALILTKLTKS